MDGPVSCLAGLRESTLALTLCPPRTPSLRRSFKSVKQDWPFGPTNYTDNLTIKKSAARRGE